LKQNTCIYICASFSDQTFESFGVVSGIMVKISDKFQPPPQVY